MNEPLVSVIIPAYNHEKFVQETILSIINQTYQNIELLILDDGSKDSTWQKIQQMKDDCLKRFANVSFETQSNHGTCYTLNRLFSYTKGKYIYLIASDDIAKPDAIKKEVEFLENNPDYALVVGDNEFIDDKSQRCFWDEKRNICYNKNEAKYLTFAQFLNIKGTCPVKFGSYINLVFINHVPNGYLIRKSILDIIEPFNSEAPLEDWFLMLQISKYAKMKYLDEILFSYRWHQNNTIKNDKLISEYAGKTFEYELNLLKRIDTNKVLPEVKNVIKYHCVLTKREGIPYIFEILTYKNKSNKYKEIKLFNICIIKLKLK